MPKTTRNPKPRTDETLVSPDSQMSAKPPRPTIGTNNQVQRNSKTKTKPSSAKTDDTQLPKVSKRPVMMTSGLVTGAPRDPFSKEYEDFIPSRRGYHVRDPKRIINRGGRKPRAPGEPIKRLNGGIDLLDLIPPEEEGPRRSKRGKKAADDFSVKDEAEENKSMD